MTVDQITGDRSLSDGLTDGLPAYSYRSHSHTHTNTHILSAVGMPLQFSRRVRTDGLSQGPTNYTVSQKMTQI